MVDLAAFACAVFVVGLLAVFASAFATIYYLVETDKRNPECLNRKSMIVARRFLIMSILLILSSYLIPVPVKQPADSLLSAYEECMAQKWQRTTEEASTAHAFCMIQVKDMKLLVNQPIAAGYPKPVQPVIPPKKETK